MEIIIGLVILAGIAWFFFMRDKKTEVAVPYKVEAPAPVVEPVKVEETKVEETKVEETKVEVIPAGTEASIAAPVKAKAPAKAKTTTAKAPAKTTTAKAPAKPKIKVAK